MFKLCYSRLGTETIVKEWCAGYPSYTEQRGKWYDGYSEMFYTREEAEKRAKELARITNHKYDRFSIIEE